MLVARGGVWIVVEVGALVEVVGVVVTGVVVAEGGFAWSSGGAVVLARARHRP